MSATVVPSYPFRSKRSTAASTRACRVRARFRSRSDTIHILRHAWQVGTHGASARIASRHSLQFCTRCSYRGGMRNVLIVGAGVAGPTLAYWLARAGFQPTVVERAQGQRSSGNPVDVRGPALPVAEQMGVVPALREAATTVTAMRLIDSSGRRGRRLPMPSGRSAAGTEEIEVPRADLAAILYAAARDHAEFVFDDTVTGFTQDPGGVDV